MSLKELKSIGYSHKCLVCGCTDTYYSVSEGWKCKYGHHFVPEVLKNSSIRHGSCEPIPSIPSEPKVTREQIVEVYNQLAFPETAITDQLIKDVQDTITDEITIKEAILWNLKV